VRSQRVYEVVDVDAYCRAAWCPTRVGPRSNSLFLFRDADLLGLIEKRGLQLHLYADDTQIFGFCRPDDSAKLRSRVSPCVGDVDTVQLGCNSTRKNSIQIMFFKVV